MNHRPATLNTDAAFCEKVCRIAQEQGYELDDMCNSITGCSFAFVHADGRRFPGGIFKQRHHALVSACKALLPEIYQNL